MTLDIIETECDCEKCRIMCHAPCCGTPEDLEKIIDAGYGARLMYDDIITHKNDVKMLKPALKGHEGERAPWETASKDGCTFWNNGKCDLHSLGLKPTQGKLANHANTQKQNDMMGEMIFESWRTDDAKKVIEKWKKLCGYK